MKKVIALSIILSASIQIFAQDTTCVFVNNNKVGQTISKEGQKEATLVLKKPDFKVCKSFIIKIKGEHISGSAYKRDLEITGDSSFIISETKDKPGNFDITNTISKQQLQAGKILKLYLLLNPSNPRMMMPSRRVFLGNLKRETLFQKL